ncbi:MAG: hypothetical protein LIO75_08115 [Lachnospiraceae bacterium]|nr:hypothetical protein [Lachnospiraceae bacterium]
MLHYIEGKKAQNPFSHDNLPVHFYTMEELCYFMEKNMYLIDASWLGEELFLWLEQELEEDVLAAHLRSSRRKTGDVCACAELLFRSSGNYTESELDEIADLLDQMRGKTKMERRKMRGDLYLEAGKYRRAAYTYMELLRKEYAIQMTEELRGNILHNLGIVYARFFLFREAAALFSEAFGLNRNPESRDACLYAMNYVDDSCVMDGQNPDLSFAVMRDALNRIAETADDPDGFAERKKAAAASEAFDWKGARTELLRQWCDAWREMI